MFNLAAIGGQPVLGILIVFAGLILALLPARLIKTSLTIAAGLSCGSAAFLLAAELIPQSTLIIHTGIAIIGTLVAALIARFAMNMLFFLAGGAAGVLAMSVAVSFSGKSLSNIEAAISFLIGGIVFLFLRKPLFKVLVSFIAATLIVEGTLHTASSIIGMSQMEFINKAQSFWAGAPFVLGALWVSAFSLGLFATGSADRKGRGK